MSRLVASFGATPMTYMVSGKQFVVIAVGGNEDWGKGDYIIAFALRWTITLCGMPARRPFAVLFDLDGTLIDTIGLLLECARHTFHGRTPAPTDEEWIAGIGTPLRKQFAAYTTSDEEVEALTQRYRSFQRQHHDRLTSAFPGVLETLDELEASGHPLGIVTSKSNEMMDRGLEWVGIMRHMKTRIGMDNAKRHKPDPHPVQAALEELGYPPDEALFLGDSPHDVASGNAAGVISVAALWGPFTREQLEPYHPQYYLERITDLPKLVSTLEARQTS